GLKRLALAPELPLISETFPGFDLGIWQSIVVPTGTPKPIVDRLFASLQKAVAGPRPREKLFPAGIQPAITQSPEEVGAFIRQQAEVREKVNKGVGMKID